MCIRVRGYGKYQVAIGTTNVGTNTSHLSYLVVLNTETGVMKTFYRGWTSSTWVEELNNELTFTH